MFWISEAPKDDCQEITKDDGYLELVSESGTTALLTVVFLILIYYSLKMEFCKYRK